MCNVKLSTRRVSFGSFAALGLADGVRNDVLVPRHMLIDLIDYIQPTLVIVGTRGLSHLKGVILGSVSHYLIQKSSAPVMVTRRRLKPINRARRPISDLQREPRVEGLANAGVEKESHGAMISSAKEGVASEEAEGEGAGDQDRNASQTSLRSSGDKSDLESERRTSLGAEPKPLTEST